MRKKLSAKEITKKTVLIAVMAALTTAVTFLVRIPTVATEGYINPGDAILLYTGVVFGPLAGFIAGGVGSCLADLAAGYAHWVIPTLIIKGIEGMTAGLLFRFFHRLKLNRFFSAVLSLIPSVIIMVAGYFLASAVMKGSFAVALVDLPGNCFQGLFGVAASMLLLVATAKIPVFASLTDFAVFYTDATHRNKVSVADTARKEAHNELSDKKKEGEGN